jgi:hypothetical protein
MINSTNLAKCGPQTRVLGCPSWSRRPLLRPVLRRYFTHILLYTRKTLLLKLRNSLTLLLKLRNSLKLAFAGSISSAFKLFGGNIFFFRRGKLRFTDRWVTVRKGVLVAFGVIVCSLVVKPRFCFVSISWLSLGLGSFNFVRTSFWFLVKDRCHFFVISWLSRGYLVAISLIRR